MFAKIKNKNTFALIVLATLQSEKTAYQGESIAFIHLIYKLNIPRRKGYARSVRLRIGKVINRLLVSEGFDTMTFYILKTYLYLRI